MRSKFSTSLLNKVNASLIIVDFVFQILEGNIVLLIKRQFKITAQSHAAEVVPENMSDLSQGPEGDEYSGLSISSIFGFDN